jgi:hypothetical protein
VVVSDLPSENIPTLCSLEYQFCQYRTLSYSQLYRMWKFRIHIFPGFLYYLESHKRERFFSLGDIDGCQMCLITMFRSGHFFRVCIQVPGSRP